MIEGERAEFEIKLAVLFAGIDKPLGDAAREAFWRGLERMSLVVFTRCVDLLLRDLEHAEGPPKRFTVGDIWQANNRLRAKAPSASPTQQPNFAWDGDVWDLNGNARLMKHVTHAICYHGARFDKAKIERLVRAKNAWAADMRDLEAGGANGVPKDLQDRIWKDLVDQAEQQPRAA